MTSHQRLRTYSIMIRSDINIQSLLKSVSLKTEVKRRSDGEFLKIEILDSPDKRIEPNKAYIMLTSPELNDCTFQMQVGDQVIGRLNVDFAKEVPYIEDVTNIKEPRRDRFKYVGQALEELTAHLYYKKFSNSKVNLKTTSGSRGFHYEMGFRADGDQTTSMTLDYKKAPSRPESPRRIFHLLNPSMRSASSENQSG